MQAAMDFYPQYSASTMYCNETGKLNLGKLLYICGKGFTVKPVHSKEDQKYEYQDQ